MCGKTPSRSPTMANVIGYFGGAIANVGDIEREIDCTMFLDVMREDAGWEDQFAGGNAGIGWPSTIDAHADVECGRSGLIQHHLNDHPQIAICWFGDHRQPKRPPAPPNAS